MSKYTKEEMQEYENNFDKYTIETKQEDDYSKINGKKLKKQAIENAKNAKIGLAIALIGVVSMGVMLIKFL
jgi:hypothetical protein